MPIKINNWSSYQSYKDRKPPWIRFHKTMLDNYEYHSMSSDARALLPMLWLLASEHNDPLSGLIEDSYEKITFRLRMDIKKFISSIKEIELAGFIQVIDLNQCNESVTNLGNLSNLPVTPETEERQRKRQRHNSFIPPISEPLLSDYLKVRKAKKAGEFTQTAFNAIEKEAKKAGLTVEQAIEYCCKRSWVGFESAWYLKDNPQKGNRGLQL